MEYPPTKRLKGLNYGAQSTTDPFGDDEDFTQDDLDEIDIIASQAFPGGSTNTGQSNMGQHLSTSNR